MSTSGKAEQQIWPTFKASQQDPFLGRKEMSPEQTLVEFISTSAAFHGVKSQSLRSLEWDLLKVFPNNIMPANAAAWYMAKRRFYANQPLDLQLLAFLLKKYPDKFKVTKLKVDFLESYAKEAARRKMIYLVQFGLHAYFSHKVEEHGVYFFDPLYYEQTEPFHESLRTCVRDPKSRLVPAYFGQNKTLFDFKIHSGNLVTVARQPGAKVMINTTGVIVSMVNNQYGHIKFGAGETAIFCAKSLFRDGWQYTGDPLRLPAMQFDAYKPNAEESGEDGESGGDLWIAVLVWCGRKPASKYYSMVADFSYTPLFQQSSKKRQLQQQQLGDQAAVEGRKLRQPSSSMMIGQVISIKKNGAVISVRDDSEDKVFVPGWCREVVNKPGKWLTTLTGDCIGLRDLVAYYIDVDESMPGYTAVGKNVMVLKEYEETDPTKKRRSRRSVSMSAGADYDHSEDDFVVKDVVGSTAESDSDDTTVMSESELEVSDSELEWLQQDLSQLMARDGPGAKTHSLFENVMSALTEARGTTNSQQTKKKGRKSSGRDSGLESRETTPKATGRPAYEPKKEGSGNTTFWRTKAALAALDQYRSSDDEDYKSGDDIVDSEKEEASVPRRRRRSKVENSQNSGGGATTSTDSTITDSRDRRRNARSRTSESTAANAAVLSARRLPYWVRAISMPEEYEPETGRFLPVDRWYKEERDPDYKAPLSDEEYEEEGAVEPLDPLSANIASAVQAAATEESQLPPSDVTEKAPLDSAAVTVGPADKAGEVKEGRRKRRGSRLPSVVAEVPFAADEVELLLKEAEEPLPEDILRGAHRVARSTSTEAKEDSGENKEEGVEAAAAPTSEEVINKIVTSVVEAVQAEMEEVSDFVRWASRALNPLEEQEGEEEEEDSGNEDDEEYVPPTVILDNDLDYDEFDAADEVLEEGELEGLLADQKMDLQRLLAAMPGTNYHAVWIPVESVKQRREAAIAALAAKQEKEEEAKKKEEEAVKEAAEGAGGADQKLTDSGLTPAMEMLSLTSSTGLTPAMKSLCLASSTTSGEVGEPVKAEKKVTRAKMVNNTTTNTKEGSSTTGAVKKSPKKLAAKPKDVMPTAATIAASLDDPVAVVEQQPKDAKSGEAAASPTKKSDKPPKRKSSGDKTSPKKSPRQKVANGEKVAQQAAAGKAEMSRKVDAGGDGQNVAAAVGKCEQPASTGEKRRKEEEGEVDEEGKGGDEKQQQAACIQN